MNTVCTKCKKPMTLSVQKNEYMRAVTNEQALHAYSCYVNVDKLCLLCINKLTDEIVITIKNFLKEE